MYGIYTYITELHIYNNIYKVRGGFRVCQVSRDDEPLFQ